MKKLLFAGIAVSMLAACSNDEVVPVNNESNAINFGVTAENGTRAADIYCSSNEFDAFKVYAKHDNNFYIKGDEIVKSSSAWENATGLRYWPNKGEVTFYGFVNGEDYFTWGTATDAPQFVDFEVNPNVANVMGKDDEGKDIVTTPGQVDLMYAVKSQEKPEDGKVNLNFRHALSQIVFNAKNVNPNLHVVIDGVSVVNANSVGTYTFPSSSTDNDIKHPTGNVEDSKSYNRGTWNDANGESTVSKPAQYDVTFTGVNLFGSKTANEVDLTSYGNTDTTVGEGNNAVTTTTHNSSSNAMLLIPQKINKYDVMVASTKEESEETYKRNGSYFLVKCKIWNVAGETFNDKTDVVLWPGNATTDNATSDPTGSIKTANVMIPADFEWEEGKKYTYTFVFGNGNGGYDPDPKNPTPDPVLVPITFTESIDEFIPVDGGQYETGVTGSNN